MIWAWKTFLMIVKKKKLQFLLSLTLIKITNCTERSQPNNCIICGFRYVNVGLIKNKTHPSGSKINAMCLILPSVGRFLNWTPSFSNRSQAFSTSSTQMAIWPNPLPGSEFPLAYPLKLGSDSVPWLCVSSSTPFFLGGVQGIRDSRIRTRGRW